MLYRKGAGRNKLSQVVRSPLHLSNTRVATARNGIFGISVLHSPTNSSETVSGRNDDVPAAWNVHGGS